MATLLPILLVIGYALTLWSLWHQMHFERRDGAMEEVALPDNPEATASIFLWRAPRRRRPLTTSGGSPALARRSALRGHGADGAAPSRTTHAAGVGELPGKAARVGLGGERAGLYSPPHQERRQGAAPY